MLVAEFTSRVLGFGANPYEAWIREWIVFVVYYTVVIVGATVAIYWRRHMTLIYNVEVDQFDKIMEQTVSAVGLNAAANGSRLKLTPSDDSSAALSESPHGRASVRTGQRPAELVVEPFVSMCHVTLHWGEGGFEIRDRFERELRVQLESAAPLENVAAAWFLNISGLVFGAMLMAVVAFVAIVFMSVRS
jgi:hypothetical protein